MYVTEIFLFVRHKRYGVFRRNLAGYGHHNRAIAARGIENGTPRVIKERRKKNEIVKDFGG